MSRCKFPWLAALGAIALFGCGETPTETSQAALAAEVKLDPALCALDRGGFTLESSNSYFPLELGTVWMYEGEEDGETLTVRITVLDETEDVGGVTTRVVEERELVDGELAEISRNFLAEAVDGTVCYFGEEVDIYEDGEVVSHEGAWRADDEGSQPGIMMPADPHPGMRFRTEGAPNAADEFKVIGIGPVEVPAGSFSDTLRVREYNPLEGSKSYKIFAADVGMLIDEELELISIEQL